MDLRAFLGISEHQQDSAPAFIKKVEDIAGVRVVRLQGPIGKEIGKEEEEAEEAAQKAGDVFSRPVLFDFKDTTGCDFATVAYLVQELRRRIAAHSSVGIINPSGQLLSELEIAKVDAWFRVFATEAEAIAELSKTARPPG